MIYLLLLVLLSVCTRAEDSVAVVDAVHVTNNTHCLVPANPLLVYFRRRHSTFAESCDKTNTSHHGDHQRLRCLQRHQQNSSSVELVEANVLLSLLPVALLWERSRLLQSRHQAPPPSPPPPDHCLLLFFYMSRCPFSAQAAPHFAALGRLAPDVQLLAVDAEQSNSVNARFGVIAVPTLLLFHGGRLVARFNESQPNRAALATFLQRHTNITVSLAAPPPPAAAAAAAVASGGGGGGDADNVKGPLWWCTGPGRHVDRWLLAAWLFSAGVAVYWTVRWRLCAALRHKMAGWWQEADVNVHSE